MASFKEHTAHILKHGVSRTNRFQVLIPVPSKLQQSVTSDKEVDKKSKLAEVFSEAIKVIQVFTGGGTTEFTRGLDLMCSQTELPGKTINISETKYNGDTNKVGSSVMYGNQQFVFKVSKDMYEKTIIDAWMNLVIDPKTHEIGYMDDYVSDITIYQLDVNDQIMHAVLLEDAFPVMSNPLTLSNLEQNNIHELMVQFAYKKWRNVELDEESGSDIDSLLDTPLGPYLSPILSNPMVQRGLEYVENATGIDLEGEAVNIYNQVDDIVRSTTGESINKSVSLLNAMKASIGVNGNLANGQITQLLDLVEGTINKIKVD